MQWSPLIFSSTLLELKPAFPQGKAYSPPHSQQKDILLNDQLKNREYKNSVGKAVYNRKSVFPFFCPVLTESDIFQLRYWITNCVALRKRQLHFCECTKNLTYLCWSPQTEHQKHHLETHESTSRGKLVDGRCPSPSSSPCVIQVVEGSQFSRRY